MTIYFPDATPSFLTTKIAICTAIADLTAPKIVTEVKAASSVEVTMVIRDWDPTINTDSGQGPGRLGVSAQMPREGQSQYQPIEIHYPYDPQQPDSGDNNKAKALLVQNAVLFAVTRKGPDINVDWTAAQQSETWKFRAGRQNKGRSGDANDVYGEYEIVQMLFPVQAEVEGILAA